MLRCHPHVPPEPADEIVFTPAGQTRQGGIVEAAARMGMNEGEHFLQGGGQLLVMKTCVVGQDGVKQRMRLVIIDAPRRSLLPACRQRAKTGPDLLIDMNNHRPRAGIVALRKHGKVKPEMWNAPLSMGIEAEPFRDKDHRVCL